MTKLILGLTGEMVSGKGTIAKYVCEKHGSRSYRFSSILRDILDRVYVEQSRENIQKISSALRENYGQDVLAKSIALDVQKDGGEVVVVDGIRRLPDIEHLKKIPGFKMIYVEAEIDKKYKRLIERNENAGDNSKTLEQFKNDHEAEAEIQIRELKSFSDYVVDNNGTFEELYAQVDRIIAENMK